jgi:gas vesicle protein
MCDSRDRTGTFLTGLAIGAAIGAGLTFLFGTEKGRQIRERARQEHPEFFAGVDEVLESLGERYEDVVTELRKVEEEVAEMSKESRDAVKERVSDLGRAVEQFGEKLEAVSPKHHRFQKNGRKL